MRKIKFRILDKESKESHIERLQDLCEDDYWYDGETDVWSVLYDCNNEQERFIAMQFTGLHDKNGKEIYEGDIVKFSHRDKIIMAPVKYGEWQESKCDEYDCSHYGYYIDYKWDNYCENTGFDLYEKIVEVVGNTYGNPELLKGADNIE